MKWTTSGAIFTGSCSVEELRTPPKETAIIGYGGWADTT